MDSVLIHCPVAKLWPVPLAFDPAAIELVLKFCEANSPYYSYFYQSFVYYSQILVLPKNFTSSKNMSLTMAHNCVMKIMMYECTTIYLQIKGSSNSKLVAWK
jgi:hypothetical protein